MDHRDSPDAGDANMLKKGTKVINRKGLNYVIGPDGRPLRYKPWIGDSFSFLYDFIMRKSIFPKKFGGDMAEHHDILRQELKGVQGSRVLELATGSGSAVNFLMTDNRYTGTDISPGLLKKAVSRFLSAGFKEAEFYVASADDLPFEDLAPRSVFVCAVPVPERNTRGSTIRGQLRSEDRLAEMFSQSGFRFESIPRENGALLYFRGIKEQGQNRSKIV
jgi:SAM-dependent methyltransferase